MKLDQLKQSIECKGIKRFNLKILLHDAEVQSLNIVIIMMAMVMTKMIMFFALCSGHKSAVSVLKFDESGGSLVSGSRVIVIFC